MEAVPGAGMGSQSVSNAANATQQAGRLECSRRITTPASPKGIRRVVEPSGIEPLTS